MFGCAGLKHKEYCIFNKQYTKEEYENLVPKIIEHMKKTGEWGEFFPMSLCPNNYNDASVQDFYPLTKEEVKKEECGWFEEDTSKNYIGPKGEVPNDINDVEGNICDKIFICEVSGKPYKIISQEFSFYKERGIPLPKRSPDQRHKDRLKKRNPKKLWNRNCSKCNKEIVTSYSPERPETVYCEECYLKEVY